MVLRFTKRGDGDVTAPEQIPGSASDFVQGDEVVVLVLGVDDNQYAAGQKAPVLVSSAVAGVVAG